MTALTALRIRKRPWGARTLCSTTQCRRIEPQSGVDEMISVIRSGWSPEIALVAVSSVAAVMVSVGGATAALAATQPVDHGATAAARARPASYIKVARIVSDISDCQLADPNRTDLCWWVDANQVGKMRPVRDAISDWHTQKEPTCQTGTWVLCASTLYNDNDSEAAWLFDNEEWEDASFCMLPGTYLADLADYDYPGTSINMNDSIISNSWLDPSDCG